MDVLITGASRGIGRAIAVRLAQNGGRIVVNYLQNKDRALETCALVEQAGGQARAIQGDVRSQDALKNLVAESVAWLGGVDALIHNAAIGALKPMDKLHHQ